MGQLPGKIDWGSRTANAAEADKHVDEEPGLRKSDQVHQLWKQQRKYHIAENKSKETVVWSQYNRVEPWA